MKMKTTLVITAVLATVLQAGPAKSQSISVPPPPDESSADEIEAVMVPAPPPPDVLLISDAGSSPFEVAVEPPLRHRLLAQAGTPSGFDWHTREFEKARGESDRMRDEMEKAKSMLDKIHFKNAGPSTRSLYVPAAAVDDKVQDEIEEDLTIMGRLIENAIDDVADDRNDRRAMGISIRTLPFGNSSRNLQIEGYGALFEVAVPFPLVPPASDARPDKPKENTSSAWEEARQQLYRSQSPGPDMAGMPGPPPGVEYDAGRVEALKETLLKSLGNASNMRHLQSKDFITVVVRSAGGGHLFHTVSMAPRAGQRKGPDKPEEPENPKPLRTVSVKRSAGSGDESVLTIRVKKSDADALAKGDLKLDEFRKRALVVVN